MIPKIPEQRKFAPNSTKPFNDLVSYIKENKGQQKKLLNNQFSDILNYAMDHQDKQSTEEKCIAIRTHGLAGIRTASIEMNAVAQENIRCADPAFHFILSWPEHEVPEPDSIFDAAEHAIKLLGLGEHQYMIAVHGNTDNIHCHVAVNRIHPVTFKSHHIEWAYKTLHMAARQSELKHGWTHDNGIYIVETDSLGEKRIVHNKDRIEAVPHAHRELGDEEILPTWNDPDSLDSWLKTKVAKALKKALPGLSGWDALHGWLNNYDITLSGSGGGGMRLHAISPETGESLDVAASKGLRILNRTELEKRWGAYANNIPVPCVVPDLSHLTKTQLQKGIQHVLTRNLDHGIPPDHIIHTAANIRKQEAQRSSGLHELPFGRVDAHGSDSNLLLQNTLHDRVGNEQTGENQDMRRPGAIEIGSRSQRSLSRDDSRRQERKEQRALARADLRERFSQYKRFVGIGDTTHFQKLKDYRQDRTDELSKIREESKLAKTELRKNKTYSDSVRLISIVEIDAVSMRRKLQVEAIFQEKAKSLHVTRIPPLSWRAWLTEQADLGDQAALSALRGIVYQAQRDAKKDAENEEDEIETDTEEYREKQYHKVMTRLLAEEQNEVAIRAANSNSMRPYEADALLARYVGIQWQVTGNGNIKYNDHDGKHLFTDRGNRLTFDRVRVSDEEIRLAIVHAQQKFGKKLILTGNNVLFTERMAQLADDMGLTILNPELQSVIANHRIARTLKIIETTVIEPITVAKLKIPNENIQEQTASMPVSKQPIHGIDEIQTIQDQLRAKVLSIDPRATFEIPDFSDNRRQYRGAVAATLEGTQVGFAQHTGRSVYVLHPIAPPDHSSGLEFKVNYQNGQAVIIIPEQRNDKGINE